MCGHPGSAAVAMAVAAEAAVVMEAVTMAEGAQTVALKEAVG